MKEVLNYNAEWLMKSIKEELISKNRLGEDDDWWLISFHLKNHLVLLIEKNWVQKGFEKLRNELLARAIAIKDKLLIIEKQFLSSKPKSQILL